MTYPAHIRKDGTEQSVTQHLRETAELAAGFGTKIGLEKTAYIAGLLHDMGKLCVRFEDYLRYAVAHPEDKSRRGSVYHAIQGAQFLAQREAPQDAGAQILIAMLEAVVACHHTGLNDFVSPEGDCPLSESLNRKEPKYSYDEVLRNFLQTDLPTELSDLLPAAASELNDLFERMAAVGVRGGFSAHLVLKYLFSCLIDADRTNTWQFETGMEISHQVPPWEAWIEKLEVHLDKIRSDSHIGRLRLEISETCAEASKNPSGLHRLTVPTGGGKTLSSLRYALLHAKEFGKDRVIYIIPYLSIIDQTASIFRDILGDTGILEHHSGLAEQFKSEDFDHLSSRWDSPLVISTMVQFLNTFFEGGTSHIRKLHQMASSVIIFDEVQSVPPHMIHIFNGVVNFLVYACNCDVVLCSATQPAFDKVKRPLIESPDSEIIPDYNKYFEAFRRTKIVDARKPGGYTHAELADFTMDTLEANELDACLIVANTKRDAAGIYRELCERNNELLNEEQYELCHLSTGMCKAHRSKIFEMIKKKLGKTRLICVSTQLIEAGVDLSFPCVIRALAGLDSISQAAGRCNRNAEVSCREVYVVNICNENLSKLKTIQEAQNTAQSVMDSFVRSEAADLQSTEVIKRYYTEYFNRIRGGMDYLIKGSTSIYDLLSKNEKACEALIDRGGEKPILPFAISSAAEAFEAIPGGDRSIIVPYEGGEGIIAELQGGNLSPEETGALLSKAQQFVINIYEWQFDVLAKEKALIPLTGELWALDKRFYRADIGLSLEGGAMEVLLT